MWHVPLLVDAREAGEEPSVDGAAGRDREGPLKTTLLVVVALAVIALLPSSATAAVCADYSTQAEAQRAADTRDADGDGIYCESLPCPCSAGSGGGGTSPPAVPAPTAPSCSRPSSVQRIVFSRSRYPGIRRHYLRAVRAGWPRILVVNRSGTDARRDRLLDETALPTRAGFDRDEYPPAVGRGRGTRALTRGINPVGWRAHVAYVRSSENRSHGSSLGGQLRRFCNGTRFRYIFR